jgi:hypothetical protein
MRHNLRDDSPLCPLFLGCFPCPYKNKHGPAAATVEFWRQELHDSHLRAPVWSETVKSSNQRHGATLTLPGVAMSPRSQYPVLWSERRGL